MKDFIEMCNKINKLANSITAQLAEIKNELLKHLDEHEMQGLNDQTQQEIQKSLDKIGGEENGEF